MLEWITWRDLVNQESWTLDGDVKWKFWKINTGGTQETYGNFVQLNPVTDILIMNNWWEGIYLIKTVLLWRLHIPLSYSADIKLLRFLKIYKTALRFILPSIGQNQKSAFCRRNNLLAISFSLSPRPYSRHNRWICQSCLLSPPISANSCSMAIRQELTPSNPGYSGWCFSLDSNYQRPWSDSPGNFYSP